MADGDLKFDTKIDTEGFSKGVNSIKRAFNNLQSTVKGTGKTVDDAFSGKTSSRVLDLNNKIEQTESRIKSLRTEMEKMASTPFVSKEADSLIAQVDKAEQQMLSLLNQREQLEEGMKRGIADLGLPAHSPEAMQGLYEANTEWQKLTSKIMQAESTLTQYESKLHDVRQADAKVSTTGTEEYAKKEQKLLELTNKLDVYKAKLNEAVIAEQKKASSANQASKSTDKLSKSMKKADKTAVPLTKSILKLSNMFKLMLMRMAIRNTINAVREGFENLAQVSPEVNANLSLLKSSLTQLKNSFATAFAPILNIVTPILNGLIQTLVKATDAVAQFFAILSGKDTYKKAVKVQEDYAKSIQKTGKQATKTAKEIQKSITGIDDVTILHDNKSDASTGGAGGAGGLSPQDMFDEVAVSAKIAEFVKKLKKKFKEVAKVIKQSFSEGFKKGLGELNLDDIKAHTASIKKSVKGIFLDPDVQSAMQRFVKNASFAIGEVSGSFASAGLTIAELVTGSIDTYLTQNSGFIKDKIISILDLRGESALIFSNFMSSLADIFTVFRSDEAKQIGADLIAIFVNSSLELLELGAKIGRDIISAIAKPITDNKEEIKEALESTLDIVDEVVGGIKDFLENTFESIQNSYDTYIRPAIDGFGEGFSTVFESVTETYKEHFAPVLKELSKKVRELINGPVADLVDSFMDFVGKLIKGISDIWKVTLAPFIAWVMKTFGPIFSKIFGGVGNVVLDMWGAVLKAVQGIFKALGGVVDFVAGIFTGDWRRAWNGVKNIFKGVFDSLVGIVKVPINLIIGIINTMLRALTTGVNAAIGALNKINIRVPDWVPGLGGKGFGFNIRKLTAPQIPRLATGTVVPANYGEFAAILGDNKREVEVVSPLSTMKQALKEALAESGGGQSDINLNVYLEGRQIYHEVVRQNNNNTRRTGINALAQA